MSLIPFVQSFYTFVVIIYVFAYDTERLSLSFPNVLLTDVSYLWVAIESIYSSSYVNPTYISLTCASHYWLLAWISRNNTLQSVEKTFQLSRTDREMLQKAEYDLQVGLHRTVIFSPTNSFLFPLKDVKLSDSYVGPFRIPFFLACCMQDYE